MWRESYDDVVLKVTGNISLMLVALTQDQRVVWQEVTQGDVCYLEMTEKVVFKPLEWDEGKAKYEAADAWDGLTDAVFE